MRNYFLLLLFVLMPRIVSADVFVGGSITADTEWSPENGVYVVESHLSIATGTTLTLLPGTVVKVGNAGLISVEGKLIAKGLGTTTPIVFTSNRDDSYGGDTNLDATSTLPVARDWQGILFNPGSSGEFENVYILYGGQFVFGVNLVSGMTNREGVVTLRNSVISNNGNHALSNLYGELVVEDSIIESSLYGLYAESGTTTMARNIVRNNSGEGIHVTIAGQLTLNDNQFINNGKTGVVAAGVRFIHQGNTSLDITNRGFFMPGIPLDGFVFHSDDLPIVLYGGFMDIQEGVSVTFSPGTVIKMDFIGDLFVSGNLNFQGSSSNPVIITSIRDDSVMGDTNGDGSASSPEVFSTNGINFFASSTANISHTIFKNVRVGITNDGGNLVLDNVKIDNTVPTGIYHKNGELKINNSEIISPVGIISESLSRVDAIDNWWGSSDGPKNTSTSTPSGGGPLINGNIEYIPWVIRDPSLPNPVLIIPGIMGSKLYLADTLTSTEVWPNIPGLLLPGSDPYLDNLSLDFSGNSILNIGAKLVIRELGAENIFNGLHSELVSFGFIENNDLFYFPYDWRLDISKIAKELENKIEEIKLKTRAQEIDIIAHSMGGLVTKRYLLSSSNASVGKFIDIGTPHLGSPKAFKIISFGDDMGASFLYGIVGLNIERIKTISHNMPSVYQLLPSSSYFDNTDNDYKYYLFDGINGNKRLSFNETKNYLKNSNQNSSLIDIADVFHQDVDNLDPSTFGVEAYNIVGCGVPTLGQIFILGEEDGKYDYVIKMIDGDGTVPLRSAEALPAIKTYYATDIQHATMSSAPGVKELVVSILKGENTDKSLFPNIKTSSAECGIPDGQLISFHSPITLDVYDEQGNHVGPNENGDIENNIPGVVYEVIEDTKFAYLPSGTNYVVKGKATEQGSFDIRVEDIKDGEVISTTLFSDIPLSLTTRIHIDMDGDVPSGVLVDKDEDNAFEDLKPVSTTTTGFLESNGKVKIVEQKTIESSLQQNRSRSTNNLTKIEKQTVIIPDQTDKNIVIQKQAKIGVVISPEFSETKLEILGSNSNQASVWSGFSKNLKEVFRRWWEWFINKLE